MFARVPLEKIVDNPFQTRMNYDDVGDLAKSILKLRESRPETSGLIQVPPARIVVDGRVLNPEEYGGVLPCLGDEPEAWVELAAGHRRVRAFRYLFNIHGDDYATFPVDVQVLDDQAMADIAWEENSKRRDLTAIEEAEALQRAIETFGWTQAEVGERWGLSQSAVANKLRLLKLPAEIQQAIRDRILTERHGRALLPALKVSKVYELVRRNVVPPQVTPEARARAAALCKERDYIYRRADGFLDHTCDACGQRIGDRGGWAHATSWEPSAAEVLCDECWRSVHWTPATVADLESSVQNLVRNRTCSLEEAAWPLDREYLIDDLDELSPLPDVQHWGLVLERARPHACSACDHRDGDQCLDIECFGAKQRIWEAAERTRVQAKVRELYGVTIPWTESYSGWMTGAKAELITSGQCGPGECPANRLRLRYHPERGEAARPYAGAPAIYACANSNSLRACFVRMKREQEEAAKTEEERAAEKNAERQRKQRRRQAREIADRAVQSYAKALRAGHEGAWQILARRLDPAVKIGLTADGYVRAIAQWQLGDVLKMGWQFNDDADVESVEKYVQERLAKAGVAMLPSTDDLIRKLERINHFVLDDEGLPRTDLTSEQVQGNLDNLTKITVEAAEMCQDGRMSEHDFERMMGWVAELRAFLGGPADEVFPGK